VAGFFSLVAFLSLVFLPFAGFFLALLAPLPLVYLVAGGRPSLLGWGWVAVVWSVVLAVGAGLLFTRHESGRVVGVTAASLSAVFWLVAMPAFPLFALTAILLDAFAIYGLLVHWPHHPASPS